MAEEFIHTVGSVKVDFTNSVTYESVGFANDVGNSVFEANLTSHPNWTCFSANGAVLVAENGTVVYVLGFTLMQSILEVIN